MKRDVIDRPVVFLSHSEGIREVFDHHHYTLDDVLDPPGRVVAGPVPTETLLQGLRKEVGVQKIYSLIDDNDVPGLSLIGFRGTISKMGFETSHYPIPDDGVPHESQLRAFIEEAREDLAAGKTIYIHCIAGLGRTGVMVGCLWIDRTGSNPDDVIAEIRRRRPGSIRTPAQAQLIRRFRYDSKPLTAS